jgi:hypothetical protein
MQVAFVSLLKAVHQATRRGRTPASISRAVSPAWSASPLTRLGWYCVSQVEVTPNSEDTITATMEAAQTTDAALNDNTASNVLTFFYDITNPTVVITTSKPTDTNTEPIDLTFTFSEDVVDFVEAVRAHLPAYALLRRLHTPSRCWNREGRRRVFGSSLPLPIQRAY